MPRARGNIERRRNSLSEGDLENLTLRMENATMKAFEKHRVEDHGPLDERLAKMDGKIKWAFGIVGGASAFATHGLQKLFDALSGK